MLKLFPSCSNLACLARARVGIGYFTCWHEGHRVNVVVNHLAAWNGGRNLLAADRFVPLRGDP